MAICTVKVGFLSVKFFKSAAFNDDYEGDRTVEDLVRFVQRKVVEETPKEEL